MARAHEEHTFTREGDDCTPSSLLENYKCFECLSTSELMAVLVIAINEYLGEYNLPEDLGSLMQDSACYTCLSDKQKFQAFVSAVSQLAYGNTEKTIAEVRDEIKCLLCAPPDKIKGALLMLLCFLCSETAVPQ